MEKIDFVGGEVRRMRAKNLVNLVAIGEMYFQVELRLDIAQFFPGIPNLPGLLLRGVLRRTPNYDRAGLERSAGAQDAFPKVIRSNYREANGLAALFGHGQRLGKKMLLDASEQLIGVKFVLA